MAQRLIDAVELASIQAMKSGIDWENLQPRYRESYEALQKDLNDLLIVVDLENLYIVSPQMRSLLKIRGMPSPVGGQLLRIPDSRIQEVLAGKTVVTPLYRKGDSWTSLYISAYTPIKNSQGKAVAIIGGDMDIRAKSMLMGYQWTVIIVLISTLSLSLIWSIWLSAKVTMPIQGMVEAANHIGQGNFNVEVPFYSKDEIGYLAQTMNDMIQDIRERDRRIQELTQSMIADLRNYNELILKGMINGVITVDLDGNVTTSNPSAIKIFNLEKADIIGKPIKEAISSYPELAKIIGDGLEQELWFENREISVSGPHDNLILQVMLTPLNDHEGYQIGACLFVSDVTKLRALEEQIRRKEKLAAIGELSAGIAHEIRNPLNSIELFLGLLQRKTKDDPKNIELAGKIQGEISKLNQILNEFLAFARPVPLRRELMNIERVIDDALFITKAEIDSAHVEVQRVNDGIYLEVNVDGKQLQRAFANIIRNAAQSMENMDKQRRLTIATGRSSMASFYVKISDTGPGIDEKFIPLIFDPFTTTKSNGTGLGLAMVNRIVEDHGGTIQVVSGKDGTTFTIELLDYR